MIDVDEGHPEGATPMFAAGFGHSRVVRILQNKGVSVVLVDDVVFAALHLSAQEGHLVMTKLLVKAGAHLEAKTSATGCIALGLAAGEGHSEVMRLLIERGANPNSRRSDGAAARFGHVWVRQRRRTVC